MEGKEKELEEQREGYIWEEEPIGKGRGRLWRRRSCNWNGMEEEEENENEICFKNAVTHC